jgi:uncharacterized protein
MDEETFSKLTVASNNEMEKAVVFKNRRYLFDTLSKASDKFYNGIYGMRGVGKTILLLQLAQTFKEALYIPADAKYLLRESLYDIAKHAIARGYKALFIDEINSRAGWTNDIKTLYDEGESRIFFSGSSSVEVKKGADLSRRVLLHELKPASFREYLNIKKAANIPNFELNQLYDKESRKKLSIKYSKWKEFLQEYYRYGGVLYEGLKEEFPKPISNSLDKMINVDLTYLREIDVKLENDLYKLLYRIAASGPYEASYSQLASYLGISKPTAIRLVSDLAKLGLLKLVYPCGGGFRKEPKIYIRIPYRYALNEMTSVKTDIGIMREEFFANNVDVECYFKTERGEKTPDFGLGGKTIEVGGVSKKSRSADYIAADGMIYGDNKIPLFLFGFLY